MNIIFQIDGGLGKSIMATAVLECIKKAHPESTVIVLTGYPDVFFNNPFADRVFVTGQQTYFYEDFIEDKDVKIHAHNPYLEAAHVTNKEHLIITWTKLFNYTYETEFPKIFLNNAEIAFHASKYASDKPIMVIQTNGGAPNQETKYSWARDLPIPIAQQVVNHFAKDYVICHIRREDQPALQNVITVSDSFRSLCVLLLHSKKRLLIDSFCNHAAAALGLPSVVCWIANSPDVFGYDLHTNIKANPFTHKPELKHSYLSKFNILGDPLEYPYNNDFEIFNVEDIITALEK